MTDRQKCGSFCQFFMFGLRYGVICEVPSKGTHQGHVRVEIAADLRGMDGKLKPRVKVWAPDYDVNEVGDTVYHGPKLEQAAKERKAAKLAEQEAADAKRDRMSAKMFRRGD